MINSIHEELKRKRYAKRFFQHFINYTYLAALYVSEKYKQPIENVLGYIVENLYTDKYFEAFGNKLYKIPIETDLGCEAHYIYSAAKDFCEELNLPFNIDEIIECKDDFDKKFGSDSNGIIKLAFLDTPYFEVTNGVIMFRKVDHMSIERDYALKVLNDFLESGIASLQPVAEFLKANELIPSPLKVITIETFASFQYSIFLKHRKGHKWRWIFGQKK